MYNKARPRRRSSNIPTTTTESKYKEIATSELRALEFLFLGLAAISPFLGALFLRYATAAVIGQESVSWFSTALFVLSTGMRPWAHVIERFRQRTDDLHDVIHYPSPNYSADDIRVQMAELVKRVEHMEKSLAKSRTRLVDATEEVYDYVDQAVTAVDRTVKRHDKKYEKQEARVKEIEHTLDGLKGRSKQRMGLTIPTATPSKSELLANILPSWIFTAPQPQQNLYVSPHSPSSKHSLRSFPSTSSIQLETIPEEEVAKHPVLAQPVHLTSFIFSRIGYIATIPLRAVIRMVLRRY